MGMERTFPGVDENNVIMERILPPENMIIRIFREVCETNCVWGEERHIHTLRTFFGSCEL